MMGRRALKGQKRILGSGMESLESTGRMVMTVDRGMHVTYELENVTGWSVEVE